MIIINSPFHITFSDENDIPMFACVSKCKSVYWDNNNLICEKCNGKIEKAVNKVHFKVLMKRKRHLNIKDFTKQIPHLSKQNKKSIEAYTGIKAKIGLLSIVKTKYIEKAKKEWC